LEFFPSVYFPSIDKPDLFIKGGIQNTL